MFLLVDISLDSILMPNFDECTFWSYIKLFFKEIRKKLLSWFQIF